MTDEPEVPPLSQEEAQRLGEERLKEVLAGGGKTKKSFACQHCGEKSYVDFDVMDTNQMVRVLTYFDDQKKGEAKTDTGRRAQLLQREVAEMTSEDLAELILALAE